MEAELKNIWFYVSLVEFVIIILLGVSTLRIKKTKRDGRLSKEELLKNSTDIDFGGLIQSSFHAKELYDKMIRKCHPDRFIDEQQRSVASEISAKLVANKHNFKALEELKELAIKKLNIKVD